MPALKDPASSESQVLVYQGLALPRTVYDHIKDQRLRLEVDYSLTLFQSMSYKIPALNGDARIPNLGHCITRMDDDGDEIQVNCIQAGAAAMDCTSGFLEHTPSGRRNPERFYCWPNYSPYFGQYLPDAMTRGRAEFPFHDLAGLARYPVDSSQLRESWVVLRIFQPQEHFKRQLRIPEIRLSDWESREREAVVSAQN
jgi:hypothetical protein